MLLQHLFELYEACIRAAASFWRKKGEIESRLLEHYTHFNSILVSYLPTREEIDLRVRDYFKDT